MAAQPNTPERVLEIARRELGTVGGAKYIRYYNQLTGSHLPETAAFCAAGVTYTMREADVPTESVPNYKGCATGSEWFFDRGRFRTRRSGYIPKPADVTMWEWNPEDEGTPWDDGDDHTGIVEFVQGGYLYTIEYNNNNMVRRVRWPLTDPYISGYGVPLFNTEEGQDLNEQQTREIAERVMKEQLNLAVARELEKIDPFRAEVADVPKWWRPDIQELVNCGAIVGDGVHGVGKRDSQIATLVVFNRMMKAGEDPIYRTIDDVPGWGRAAVQERIDAGKLNGVEVLPDGTRILNIRQSMVRMIMIVSQWDREEQQATEAAAQEHLAEQE